TLTASAVGGLGPYSYTWSTGPTTSSIFVSAAGTYTVTLSDKLTNKCGTTSISVPVTIGAINATPSHTDASCFGSCNGVATATVVGGTGPYTYVWSNGVTNTGFSPKSISG